MYLFLGICLVVGVISYVYDGYCRRIKRRGIRVIRGIWISPIVPISLFAIFMMLLCLWVIELLLKGKEPAR